MGTPAGGVSPGGQPPAMGTANPAPGAGKGLGGGGAPPAMGIGNFINQQRAAQPQQAMGGLPGMEQAMQSGAPAAGVPPGAMASMGQMLANPNMSMPPRGPAPQLALPNQQNAAMQEGIQNAAQAPGARQAMPASNANSPAAIARAAAAGGGVFQPRQR